MPNEFGVDATITFRLDPRWRELESRFQKVVEIAARHVETKAKDDVPVKTGATKNSINASSEGELSWRVGPTTEYAPFLEYGTRHMIARPFLIPAVELEAPRLERALIQVTQELS